MQVHDMARPVAATHLSLWFGGFAVGCFFIGTLSDRLGRRKPVLIGASHVYGLIWLIWLSCMALPLTVTYVLFALMGLSTAAFSLTWACAKEVNPPMLSGMSTSVANMGGFLAGALLQPFVGWVMDLGWKGDMVSGARVYDVATWQSGVLVVTVVAILGAVSSWWIKETRCRNIWQPPAA
jgi:MFS family permease